MSTSAWGVVHKAAYKAFFPAPPGVSKLPRSAMKMTSSPSGALHEAHTLRGKPIGSLSIEHGTNTIGTAVTEPGFRRRGVASNLLANAEKQRGAKIEHSTNRTPNGNAFAQATDRKRGAKPPALSAGMAPKLRSAKSKPVLHAVGSGKNKTIAFGSDIGRTGIKRGKKKISYSARPQPAAVDNGGGWF